MQNELPKLVGEIPGAKAKAWVDRLAAVESPAFTARRARRKEATGAEQDPIVWARAEGSVVIDVDGNEFIDFTSGFGVAALGHSHPRVLATIQQQSQKLMHGLGDLHPSEEKILLMERLAKLVPFDARVVLSLSGSDAVETALKTAVLATGKPGVLAFRGGYHGLAHGPLSACGYSEGFRKPFVEQLNRHVRFADYVEHDLDSAMAEVMRVWDASVGCVLIEPLQGRGGCRAFPAGFLAALRDECSRRGVLLIVDEVMTGLGRTGAHLLSQELGVDADLICLGKALGGGLPLSACIGREEVMRSWGDPSGEAIHTGTFFGHPLSAAVALTVLDTIDELGLAHRSRVLGDRFAARLHERGFRPVGLGLLHGVDLSVHSFADRHALPGLTMAARLLQRGYLTLPARHDAGVLQILPSLLVSEDALDRFVDVFTEEAQR